MAPQKGKFGDETDVAKKLDSPPEGSRQCASKVQKTKHFCRKQLHILGFPQGPLTQIVASCVFSDRYESEGQPAKVSKLLPFLLEIHCP
jgi:hypothetical protein